MPAITDGATPCNMPPITSTGWKRRQKLQYGALNRWSAPPNQQEDDMNCELCGEPMPEGEKMFKYHGYSGPCPKPTLLEDTATLAAVGAPLDHRAHYRKMT